MKRPSTIHRAIGVQQLVGKHYEPGRQDRCKLWVYRHYVYPQYHIGERTFFSYLAMKVDEGELPQGGT
jgi:hypothetical protein